METKRAKILADSFTSGERLSAAEFLRGHLEAVDLVREELAGDVVASEPPKNSRSEMFASMLIEVASVGAIISGIDDAATEEDLAGALINISALAQLVATG